MGMSDDENDYEGQGYGNQQVQLRLVCPTTLHSAEQGKGHGLGKAR